jgi:hypothetical protein
MATSSTRTSWRSRSPAPTASTSEVPMLCTALLTHVSFSCRIVSPSVSLAFVERSASCVFAVADLLCCARRCDRPARRAERQWHGAHVLVGVQEVGVFANAFSSRV